VLVFPKDRTPPTDAFWSISSYRDDSLTPGRNAIERHSIGDLAYRLKRKWGGQTVIYIQHVRPAEGKVRGWLPVPNEPFNLVLRAYGPSDALRDGTYVLPAVQRGENFKDD